jgi:hypothetical protein
LSDEPATVLERPASRPRIDTTASQVAAAVAGRLDPSLRARAAALLAATPWGQWTDRRKA